MGTQMSKCCAQSFVSNINDADDEIFGTTRAVDIDEKAKLLPLKRIKTSSDGNGADDQIENTMKILPQRKSHSISSSSSLSPFSCSESDGDVLDDDDDDDNDYKIDNTYIQQLRQPKKSRHKSKRTRTPYPKAPKMTKLSKAKKTKSVPTSNKTLRSRAIMKEKRKIRALRKCISMNLEQELEATEMELMTHKHALELLKAQNDQLRAQNEQFINKYGTHFGYNNSSNHSQQSLDRTAPHMHQAMVSPVFSGITPSISALSTAGPPDIEPLGHGSIMSSMSKSMSYTLETPLEENLEIPHQHHPLFTLTHSQTQAIIGFTHTARDKPNAGLNVAKPKLSMHQRSQSVPVSVHGFDEEEELETDGGCKSVGKCKAIKRLVIALKWYQDADGDYDGLMKRVKDSTYDKDIVDDYQHLLNHHLIHEYDGNGSAEYQLLQSLIHQLVKPCNPLTCDGYKRHDEIMKKNLSGSGFYEFSIDFMDLVHCCLMHSNESTELNEDFVEIHE